MLIEYLVGKRLADDPKDAQTEGHRLLLRGGYIRQVGQGIYSLLPMAHRACQKVQAIIREEMNNLGGQEMLMPVVSPAELWQESGRYDTVGSEMLRFTDRNDHPCVLNMTHEEIVVDAARSQVDSYRQFPFMLYQFQTKFRDEPRSRGGLIRVREFTMKDAYSFHRTQEDLEVYYAKAHRAYERIFQRVGMKNVIDIESDSGMMGGNIAHEFMLVHPIGEDTLVLCDSCGYRANREVATTVRDYTSDEAVQPLTEVETPNQKTIEEVTGFLGTNPTHACKCVAFMGDEKPIFAFVRGDFDVNQAKLKTAAQVVELRPMDEEEFEACGSVAGFVGPIGIDSKKVTLLFDESVAKSPNLVVGANKRDWHATGFNFSRDLPEGKVVDLTDVLEGDVCPKCQKPLRLARGVEVGNIFQLGTKYSSAMSFTYAEEGGEQATPIMGCYGIGVGRTMASVLEENHDKYGPIWPMPIAPFQVQVCCLQAKKAELVDKATEIYEALKAAGVEVLLDKRSVGAGFMFADADLIGAPIRLVISNRNIAKGVAEVKFRIMGDTEELPKETPLENVVEFVQEWIGKLIAGYQPEG
jgi:prolyl-tRNA synthetase